MARRKKSVSLAEYMAGSGDRTSPRYIPSSRLSAKGRRQLEEQRSEEVGDRMVAFRKDADLWRYIAIGLGIAGVGYALWREKEVRRLQAQQQNVIPPRGGAF